LFTDLVTKIPQVGDLEVSGVQGAVHTVTKSRLIVISDDQVERNLGSGGSKRVDSRSSEALFVHRKGDC